MRRRKEKRVFVTQDGRVPEMRRETLPTGETGYSYAEPVRLGFPGVPWSEQDRRLVDIKIFYLDDQEGIVLSKFGGG